jgi:hypothetical protein
MRLPHRSFRSAVLLVALTPGGPLRAADPPVKGAYLSHADTVFTPVEATAFRREDYDGKHVVVLLLAGKVSQPPIAGTLDVEAAVEARKEEAGSWIELAYREDGSWMKTRYFFKSGGGGSSGSSYSAEQAPQMKAVIVEGRVTGHVTAIPGPGEKLDFTLAVPIEEAAAGQPLPADGGEPAKALRACHAAYAAKKAALSSACSQRFIDEVTSALQMRAEGIQGVSDPWTPGGSCNAEKMPGLEIQGGVIAGEEARLQARGKVRTDEGQDRVCGGQVFLRRQNGAWRVSASRMDSVAE